MPRLSLLWIFVILPFLMRTQDEAAQNDSFTVYFFLLEDCMITQAYTSRIQELYQDFSNDSTRFMGKFPNPISQDSTIDNFVSTYGIPFPCTREGAYALAKRFGVSVTPEVVVFNESRQQVMYQGRIDDLYVRVGKRRKVVTSHELRDALQSIRDRQYIAVPKTEAIGCFLK